MSTSATSSQGTAIKMLIGSPGVMTLIPQVTGLTGPSVTKEFEEITNLDSPGAFKEWQASINDGGTVSFTMIGKSGDTVQAALRAASFAAPGPPSSFELDFPAGYSPSKIAFLAHVTKVELQAQTSKVIKYAVELKITGQPTETA